MRIKIRKKHRKAYQNNEHNNYKGHKIILKHNFWSTTERARGGTSDIKHLYLILDNNKNHKNDMTTITTMENGKWEMLRAVSSGKHCFKLSAASREAIANKKKMLRIR